MKKIIFLHQSWTGFEKRDWEILKNNFCAQDLRLYTDTLLKIPHGIRAIKKADAVFCWFASRLSLIPLVFAKIFKKKIILVVGGWDCANVPEINYGALRKGIKFFPTKVITKYIISLADRIIAVSGYNKKEIIENCKISSDRIHLIYHGIPFCPCEKSYKKENSVLTVGNITENNLKRKGLATFIKAAAMLPETKFFMVGKVDARVEKYLHDSVPKNVIITGFLDDEALCQFYSKAKVYVQVSYHEQFGCALAEAMAHGCVPVVTDTSALPEVVGEAGYYVPYGDAEKTAAAITMALTDGQKGAMAQERITKLFPFEKREQALVDLIEHA